jgi:hypothetical protein
MVPYEIRRIIFPTNAAMDLQPLPGESITSSLWRFAWRNGLKAKELLVFCSTGTGYAKEEGPSRLNRRFDPEVFRASSGWEEQLGETRVVEASQEQHRRAWWSSQFRYCPLCLEQLYHSFWHQSTFLSHCPVDGAALLDECYSCGARTPAYGFHRTLLNHPYTCQKCRGPISGIKVSLSSRLIIQQRADELKRIFADVEHSWGAISPARQEVEFLLPERKVDSYAPWLRPETSLRQWIVEQVPGRHWLATTTRTLPALTILKWRVRLMPLDPLAWINAKRTYKHEQLSLAQQVYRATLTRLMKAISVCSPFDEADFRSHEVLPTDDPARLPDRCNLHLLAFIKLRRSYETYFSALEEPPEKARFDTQLVGFPYGYEFADRVRICWRAQFIAEYASLYWWILAARDGRKRVGALRRRTSTMRNIDIQHDREKGDLVSGSVAFPAVDGLNLTLFP